MKPCFVLNTFFIFWHLKPCVLIWFALMKKNMCSTESYLNSSTHYNHFDHSHAVSQLIDGIYPKECRCSLATHSLDISNSSIGF